MLRTRKNMFFKIIAIVVSAIFLWDQIVWAADIVSTPIITSTQPDYKSTSRVAPQKLSAKESVQKSLIANKQAIEDFNSSVNSTSPHGLEYDRIVTSSNGWTYYYLANRTQEQVSPKGYSYVYREYEQNGNIKTSEYYNSDNILTSTSTYHHDADGNFLGKTTTYANGTVYEQNEKYKTIKITYANGNYTLYTYLPNGKTDVITYYNADSEVIYTRDYIYGQDYELTGSTTTYADGRTYLYDANNRLTKVTYANGNFTIYTRLTDGKTDTMVYCDAEGEILYTYKYAYDPSGNIKTFEQYDSGNTLTSISTYHRDADGNFLGKTTTYANGTVYEQNEKYKTTKITYANGNYTIYVYLTNGKTAAMTYYDESGEIIYTRDYAYDQDSNLAGSTATYADGKIYLYNVDNRLVKAIHVDGNYTTYMYLLNGKTDTTTYYDANGEVISIQKYTYDQNGNIKTSEQYDSDNSLISTSIYRRDAAGNFLGKTTTYANGTVYEQNEKYKTTKVTYVHGNYMLYTYLPNDKMNTITYYDANGEVIYVRNYAYDQDDELTGSVATYTDGKIYLYNANNRLVKVTYANGKYMIYTRFTDGKTDTVVYYDASGEVVSTYKYTYDQNGNIKTYETYDSDNILISTIAYHRDADGNFLGKTTSYANGTTYEQNENYRTAKITYASGNYTIYTYLPNDKTDTITYYGADNEIIRTRNCVYNQDNELTGSIITYADGREYLYDENNRLVKAAYSNGTYTTYTYLPDGKTDVVTYYDASGEFVYTRKYTYDQYNQSTGTIITYPDGTVYEQDVHGRILKIIYVDGTYRTYTWFSNGHLNLNTLYHANDQIDVETFYKSNEDISRVKKYMYDQNNQLTGAVTTHTDGRVSFYDVDGRIIKAVSVDGSYKVYVRDPDGPGLSYEYYDTDDVWIKTETYHYDESGNYSGLIVSYADGTVREQDKNGWDIKNTYPDGTYRTYTWLSYGNLTLEALYHANDQINTEISYDTSGEVEHIKGYTYDQNGQLAGWEVTYSDGKIDSYDANGILVKTTLADGSYEVYIRYPDGALNRIIRSDGSWEEYDTEGVLIRRGEEIGDTEVVYDKDNRIEALAEGAYEEKRQYVFSEGEILYTLALYEGVVKAVRAGYYGETELISRSDLQLPKEDIKITYDNDVTVGYSGNEITSLSAEGGYVSFYNGTDVTAQNSAEGDLYLFEDNFLKQAATVGGNIYNFDKTIDTSGVSVYLAGAVIDGVRYGFSGAKLSSIYSGSAEINIVSLVIKNDLNIESLIVDPGSGEEEAAEGSAIFIQVQEVLRAINSDIPNLKFDYSSGEIIEEILTSGYSRIFFQDGLIVKIISAEGVEVNYDLIDGADGTSGLHMTESGVVRTFDNSGKLVSMELADGESATSVTFEDEEIASIESEGSLFEDITFDVDGNIDSAHLIKADGSEYFFSGGMLQDFIDDKNFKYDLDGEGKITQLTRIDTGEIFACEYSVNPDTGRERISFTSDESGSQYVYESEFLIMVKDSAGLSVDYTYDDQGRTQQISISYGGINNSTYTYEYLADETIMTDDLGNKRYYDADNNPVKLKTPYGETYRYGYDTDGDGNAITIVNYAYKEKEDGTVIEYFKGSIKTITRPDGSQIDNIEFDPVTGKLRKFSLHTADNKHRNVILSGDFVQFEMEDSTRLIFYEDKLVAFGSSQGITPLYDLEGLDDIIYVRDPEDASGNPSADIDIAASNWRHQTYEDSQAIQFVERNYDNDWWELNVDLKADSGTLSKGEMFLDLRYDIPGLEWQAPIDMRGEEISFLFKLDDSFEYDPANPCDIQVLAKDKNWNTQYGTKVEMITSGGWIEISLTPTEDNINLGYTDAGFDSSSITMIGLRITAPENAPGGLSCLGKVLVKHNILPNLFENVNYGDSPLDDLYESLGISRDLDLLKGEDGDVTVETYLENFADALKNGPSGAYQKSLLEMISWKVEAQNSAMKGIKSVYREASSGELVLDASILSASGTNSEGEIFFDVRTDVPGLGWSESVNLTSQPVKMLISVPDGMTGTEAIPNGARIFVKDENMNVQYGTWVNLKEPGKWYSLELMPTFGEIPMGYTDESFDPSKIIQIGVSVISQPGSGTNFNGELRVKFLPGEDGSGPGDIVNMPLWMDLRGAREYLVDEDDNYIRVPGVNYLPQEYFSYVFNRGSGEVPTANFDALEKSNTVWKVQTSAYKGITDVSWNADGNALTVGVNINSLATKGEIFLDMRYGSYVPDKNWQREQPLDMTTQEIAFYVRTRDGFTANTSTPLYVEVFAKDSPDWDTEYSRPLTFDLSDEWTKVTLTPLPGEFNQGYTDPGFDPTQILAFGLRVRSLSSSYTYSGDLEIKYEINGVDLGTYDLGDTGTLPSSPVWINQRDIADYIAAEGIAFYGDYSIMTEVNQLIAEVPEYSLPTDFAAFTVYDEDDNVSYITKPDGTTTWFDDEARTDFITYENGDIFIDYEYDDSGDLAGATLVTARDELVSAMSSAMRELEQKTADVLLLFAEEKSLLEESYMEEVNAQRKVFSDARSQLNGQRYQRIKHNTFGVIWYSTVEVPGIDESIRQVNAQEAEFNQQVSETLALLDDEVRAKKDTIEAEKVLILEEYTRQQEKMLLAIIREEAVPVLYYYYRNILGRDSGKEEVLRLLNRIDANNDFAGFFSNDFTQPEELILALRQDPASPVYAILSDESKTFIDNFVTDDEIDDETLAQVANDLDGVVGTYDLYSRLAEHYGTGAFEAKLSAETISYKNNLTSLAKDISSLSDTDKSDIRWLNRYILQDLFPFLTKKDKDAAIFTGAALKTELTSLDEYATTAAFKENVTTSVMASLGSYLNDPSLRFAMLFILGISQENVIEITGDFLKALQGWMEGQDLHFGRSAFGALKKMLDENGVVISLETLAKEALLIDILMGISGPMMDKDIEISMFTMNTIATRHGVRVKSARLNYSDILTSGGPFITLVNKNHYVTVLSVSETEITYWDQNMGISGGEVTLSRKDFEDNWQGNVITSGQVSSEKLLSDAAIKKIKGAFFGIGIGSAIIMAIFTAVKVAVIVAIKIITFLVTGLVTLVGHIGAFLVNAMTGLGNLLTFVGKAFMGIFGVSGGAAAAGEVATGFSLGTLFSTATTTLFKVGVAYGTSIGLEAMGVDPLVAGLISSVVTGGVHGFLSGGGLSAAFNSAMQFGAATGMNMVGQHFDLDPMITGILSMSTFALTGGTLDPNVTFGVALKSVVTDMAWELSAYGIEIAGTAMGISPGVSRLASIGIRSSLQAGLGTFGQGGGSPGDWYKATVKELTKPTNLALALNIVGDTIGLPPLINNMIITIVAGAIDGFNENPESRITGMFRGMFDNFWNASVRALTFGTYDPIHGGWNKDVQKDYTLMNLTRFIEVIQEQGIEAAIENHLSNIFRDEAIRVINQEGGISDFLTGKAEMVEESGEWLKKINVTDQDKLYLDPNTDDIIGRDYGGIKERGEYGINPYTGGFGLIGGTLEEKTENGTRMVYHVSNSTVIDKIEVYGTNGGYMEVIAKDKEAGLELNEDGIPLGGIVADFEKGKLYEYEYLGDSIDFEMNFDDPMVDVQSVVNIDFSSLTGQQKEDLINYYLVMNGIVNPNPYGSPRYMFSFETDLANADPLPREDIALIPLYCGEIPEFAANGLIEVVGNPFDLFDDLISNGYVDRVGDSKWGKITKKFFDLMDSSKMILDGQFEEGKKEIFDFLNKFTIGLFGELGDKISDGIEWVLKTEEVAAHILQGMNEANIGEHTPDITSVNHSGSGDPFVYLLNQNLNLDVKSIVFVGAPIKGTSQILNANVETVVNIYGDGDEVFQDFNNKFRDNFDGTHLFDNNPTDLKEIAIELKGIKHDYFYDPGNPREGDKLRKKSSEFIAKITAMANDEDALIEFLENTSWIKPDQLNNKYVVTLQGMVI